jgi:peptide/nickel transport system substrate-binding protein
VGIHVTVNALPREQQFHKVDTRDTDFYLYGFGTGTFDSFEYLRDLYQSHGSFNATGFADRRIDDLIEKIARETVITYARDALVEDLWRTVLDKVVYLPLYYPTIVWAIRDPLEIPVFYANNPRLRQARFKESRG